MKKILVIAVLLCAPLMACANPDYVNKNKNNPESKPTKCDVYFKKLTACGMITWAVQPGTADEVKFQLNLVSFSDPTKAVDLENTALKVVLWMPSMGHGSSPTSVEKISDVSYDVSKVYFIMQGDWEIHFQFSNLKETIDEAIYSVQL